MWGPSASSVFEQTLIAQLDNRDSHGGYRMGPSRAVREVAERPFSDREDNIGH